MTVLIDGAVAAAMALAAERRRGVDGGGWLLLSAPTAQSLVAGGASIV